MLFMILETKFVLTIQGKDFDFIEDLSTKRSNCILSQLIS